MGIRTVVMTGLLILVCSKIAAIDSVKPIRIALHWKVQSEFAGFYAAKYKNFYNEYGLDIELKNCDGSAMAIEMLRDGKADFATVSLQCAILQRSAGIKLVNLAQLMQKSPVLFIAKKTSGIKKPVDMNGKKVALWRTVVESVPKAFFQKYKIKPIIVPVNSGIDLFLKGGADVLITMSYNEYHSVLNAGVDPDELVVFSLSDYGFDIPYTGIYCLENTWEENPVICQNFVKATLKGWQYVFEHQNNALYIVIKEMKKQHRPASKAHQRWMLLDMNKLFLFRGNGEINTNLSEKSFNAGVKILKTDALIQKNVSYDKMNKTGDSDAEK